MQKLLEREPSLENLSCSIVFEGLFYTIASAQAKIKGKYIIAEGASRRSYKDKNDPIRAKEIASGRALKALQMRIEGEREQIHLHHLLMAA